MSDDPHIFDEIIDPPNTHIEPFVAGVAMAQEALENKTETTPVDKASQDDDFKEAKRNLKSLIERGTSALNGLYILAQSSENARAYEVLGGLIKTLSELNGDLVGLHEKKAKIDGATAKAAGPASVTVEGNQVVNNVVFSGTTKELNDLIEKSLNKQS